MKRTAIAFIIFGFFSNLLVSASGAAIVKSAITAPTIPVNIGIGTTVKATPSLWPANRKSSYQWLENGKKIDGETKITFDTTEKDSNQTLQFSQVVVISSKTTVLLSNQVIVGRINIAASPTLSFANGTKTSLRASVSPSPLKNISITYQWLRGSFGFAEATNPIYVLATVDQGTQISVKVVLTAPKFNPTSITSNSLPIPIVKRDYSLIWSDEFNSSINSPINSTIWKPENGDGTASGIAGWGNQEREYYLGTLSNIDGNGNLAINATKTGAEAINCYYRAPCEWLSSKFITKGLVGFKYGRIEVRIKGPIGDGSWGAFWMLGANIDDARWPLCGEIDVAELLGRDPKTVYGTAHGPLSGGPGRGNSLDLTTSHSDGFHVYSVDWLPDQLTWYVDGQQYAKVNKIDKDWVFDHEFYLILNLAMGGEFGGDIDPKLTATNMSVDYVRVYSINGFGEVVQH